MKLSTLNQENQNQIVCVYMCVDGEVGTFWGEVNLFNFFADGRSFYKKFFCTFYLSLRTREPHKF